MLGDKRRWLRYGLVVVIVVNALGVGIASHIIVIVWTPIEYVAIKTYHT